MVKPVRDSWRHTMGCLWWARMLTGVASCFLGKLASRCTCAPRETLNSILDVHRNALTQPGRARRRHPGLCPCSHSYWTAFTHPFGWRTTRTALPTRPPLTPLTPYGNLRPEAQNGCQRVVRRLRRVARWSDRCGIHVGTPCAACGGLVCYRGPLHECRGSRFCASNALS